MTAAELIGTEWVGGARYWRGQLMYRPTWRIEQVKREPVRGFWPGGSPPDAWFVYMLRVDDNSLSEPPGKRRRIALQVFEGFGPCPTYRRRDARFANERTMAFAAPGT